MKITIEGAKITGYSLEADDEIRTEVTYIVPKTDDRPFQYFSFRLPGRLGILGEAVKVTFETLEEKAKAHAN
jgi:hypothetical protein